MTLESRTRLAVALLLRLYPKEFRETAAVEMHAAVHHCVRRERTRLGRIGVAYAWVRIVVDAIWSAALMRVADRQRRRIVALHQPPNSPGDSPMSSLWQDVRYAARTLGRAPGFTAIVVVTLGLAIGANTAIFSIVNGVLLRPLSYRDPDRLVALYEAIPKAKSGPIGFSAPDFVGIEARARSVESIAAFANREFELSGVTEPERLMAARVSASLFTTLGVDPALGRTFTREEDVGRHPLAILSESLWRRKFASDPSVLGRAVILDRQAYTIVGVMPRGFVFPNRGPVLNNVPADVYVPISFTERELTSFASMYNNSVVARLKPGITAQMADSEMRTLATSLVREVYPAAFRDGGFGLSASATPLRDETVGRVERLLYILLGAVAVVLLIACADVTNLMLTRAAAREKEMAVRVALGASRWQLVRQVLTEASLLAAMGGVVGVVLARWGTAALLSVAPVTIPRTAEIGVDRRVLLFAVLASFVTALLCGLVPAWESSRRDSGDALKEGGRGGTAGRRQRHVFGTLVTAQFALAVVLLVAGGLLLRSLARLTTVDPGFRAEHMLTLATSLPAQAYPSGTDVRGFYLRLLERTAQLPAVVAVGASTNLPLSVRERRAFTAESEPASVADVPHVIAHDWIMGRYFEAMGIALRRGRLLQDGDRSTSEPVVVINETMARTFWPDRDAVDQRIAWGGRRNDGRWMRIVGVVADVKQGPLGTQTVPQSYQPWLQVPDGMIADNVVGALRAMKISIRTAQDPSALALAAAAQVRTLDPALPVTQVQMMTDVVAASTRPQRFTTWLLVGFAAVALLLAALGIAGVLATSVSQRTHEIGVRMALGAQRKSLVLMILRQGMTLVVAGLAIGVACALALSRVMSSLLFEIGPRDPITFAGVAAVLTCVALAACYLPAHRATRVDPINALRHD